MDFIERLFGVAPDGGNGGYELLLLVLPLVIAYAVRRNRTRRS
jgi:hypothetical protein